MILRQYRRCARQPFRNATDRRGGVRNRGNWRIRYEEIRSGEGEPGTAVRRLVVRGCHAYFRDPHPGNAHYSTMNGGAVVALLRRTVVGITVDSTLAAAKSRRQRQVPAVALTAISVPSSGVRDGHSGYV